jgi:hypothetical protein
MANWSQEMVPDTNLFHIKLFLIAKFDCSIYSHKKVFYDLNIKRRCIKIRILLQNAFNPKVKFQLKVDLPSLPEDYPLSYTGTVVCKSVHKFASVWCKTASGEVGVSLP